MTSDLPAAAILALAPADCAQLLPGDPAAMPGPMRRWLRQGRFAGPIEEYREWQHVLRDSFGPRRFVPMRLTADDLYT